MFYSGDSRIASGKEKAQRTQADADDGFTGWKSRGSSSYRRKIATGVHFQKRQWSRKAAQHRLVDELLGLFGGRKPAHPWLHHHAESGTLTLDDVREAERTLMKLAGEEKPQ